MWLVDETEEDIDRSDGTETSGDWIWLYRVVSSRRCEGVRLRVLRSREVSSRGDGRRTLVGDVDPSEIGCSLGLERENKLEVSCAI